MDLGIAGRTALVCGSTRGLGRACAEALVREGVTVYINGRDATRLDGALHALRVLGGQVHGVQGDVGTAEGRSALLARSEEHTSELQSLMRISYAVFCLKK